MRSPLSATFNPDHPVAMKKMHHELMAWKLSMELAKDIYELTRDFPRTEQYGLSSQLRRAAISIPSNIAEGAARKSHREFRQFLYVARGSLAEIETQLMLARALGFPENDIRLRPKLERLFGLIGGLIRTAVAIDG